MSMVFESAEIINNLKNSVEDITGESYENLTEAVQALKDGYSSSSEAVVTGITDFTNFCLDGSRLDVVDKFDTSEAELFDNMFHGCTDLVTTPDIDMSNGKSATYMLCACNNLVEVKLQNANKLQHVEYMFKNCGSLETIPEINTSNCTDLTQMFYETPVKNVPYLDTSKAESCSGMFSRQYCANNTLVLSNVLDMSNCTDCMSMFRARTLNTFPVKNTQKVTTFRFAFWGNSFTEAELDLTSCTDMRSAFYSCSKLAKLTLHNTQNITSGYWDQCFYKCSALADLNIDYLNINSNTLDFSYCTKLSIESLLNILNALSDNSENNTTYTVKLGTTNLNKLSAEQKQIATDKNIALA